MPTTTDDIDATARASAEHGPCPLEMIRRTLRGIVDRDDAHVERNLAALAARGEQPGEVSDAEAARQAANRRAELEMIDAVPAHPERHESEGCAPLAAEAIRRQVEIVRGYRGQWTYHAALRMLIAAVGVLWDEPTGDAAARAVRLVDAQR